MTTVSSESTVETSEYHHNHKWRKSESSGSKMYYDTIGLLGVPVVDQKVTNLTSIQDNAGLIPGLAQWVKDLALP